MTFFASRWVDRAGPRAPSSRAACPGLPRRGRGRRGSSRSGGRDVGLLVCDAPTPSAPRASRAPACWPRRCSSPRSAAGSTRCAAVVANSGNANAAAGRRGIEDGRADAGRRGDGGRGPSRTRRRVASTGVIGVQLDADTIVGTLPDVHAELSNSSDAAFTEGCFDHRRDREARAALQVDLGGTASSITSVVEIPSVRAASPPSESSRARSARTIALRACDCTRSRRSSTRPWARAGRRRRPDFGGGRRARARGRVRCGNAPPPLARAWAGPRSW